MKPKDLSQDALTVLSSAVVEGAAVRLTTPNLDRKLYLEVNAALEALGGTWNRKAKVHLFAEDPETALDRVLVDGAYSDTKRDLDQFFTPDALATMVARQADVRGHVVLEPSAGHGALARACLVEGADHVQMVEMDPACHTVLGNALPFSLLLRGDFLTWVSPSASYARIVMNPPFSRQQDLAHVTKAYGHLAPGGKLVAIMAAGIRFRADRKSAAFRALVDRAHGTIAPLPDDSFKESGTGVRTVLVTMHKAAA